MNDQHILMAANTRISRGQRNEEWEEAVQFAYHAQNQQLNDWMSGSSRPSLA